MQSAYKIKKFCYYNYNTNLFRGSYLCTQSKLHNHLFRMIRFGILTVSTTCSKYPEKDTAGPALKNEISKAFPDGHVILEKIIGDEKEEIINFLNFTTGNELVDVLFTVGGTGFAESDVTPEATKAVIDKEAPGLSYAMISKSLAITEMAMLSRPVCGIKNKVLIINFPGSAKAAVECFGFIKNSLDHAVALLKEATIKVAATHEQIQNSKIEQNNSRVSASSTQEGTTASGFMESKVKIKAGSSRKRKSEYEMLEINDAIEILYNEIDQFKDSEEIPIQDALGRILGKNIIAPHPVPPFPASIKDGYAVKMSDGTGIRKVRSATAAGDEPGTVELQAGEVIRISTGAPVPPGADAVVQVEDTTLVEASPQGDEEIAIEIQKAPKLGQDIRPVGSDIEEGTIVLKIFSKITAASIGVLTMLGFTTVPVIRRPSIGVISSGNELQNPSETLKPGHIYDSNKVTLLTLLKSNGFDAKDCGIARDSPNSTKAILESSFENHDIIISSGGVSMGEYDLIKEVLIWDFHARILVGRINMKPGKPTVIASLTYKNKPKVVFALPGNPVSCSVTCLLFVIPALKFIEMDETFNGWPRVDIILKEKIVNRDSRPEYVRLTVSIRNNQLEGVSTGNQISSRLNSMVNANALMLVPGNTTFEENSVHSVSLVDRIFT